MNTPTTPTTTTTVDIRKLAAVVLETVEQVRQIKIAQAQPSPPGIVGAVHRAHLRQRLEQQAYILGIWDVLVGIGAQANDNRDVALETAAAIAQNVLDGHPVILA